MLIDVHAHLNDEKLMQNALEIIKKSKNQGVEKIICAAYDKNSAKIAFQLSQNFKEIYCALGVHPSSLEDFDENFIEFLINIATNKKVVAVGEIGLDYHFLPFDKQRQKSVFIEQLLLANQLKLPVQIHCRDAICDLLDVLNKNKQLLKNSGIVHCFGGSIESLQEIQKLGLKVSLGGVATFKNATQVHKLVKEIPIDMIMLETDCPYLTPHPHRGELNEPSFLPLTAQKIAELKDMPYNTLCNLTTANAFKVFSKLCN